MTELAIFEVLRSALWAAVLMSLPILSVTLILGFVVGLLQALTSIQELTLTFVPKIFAVVVVLFLTLGYMTSIALDLFNNTILPIVAS